MGFNSFIRLFSAFLIFAALGNGTVYGQDTLAKLHSPKKAAIFSACLPGLGQAYNKKYWKIPLVYAGMGIPVWFVNYTHREFKSYKQAYIFRTDDDPNTTDNKYPRFSDEQVRENVDFYRRYRDLNLFLTALFYGLNIVDASVDAHLKNFDVSNQLSLRYNNQWWPQMQSYSHGLSIGFKF